jgi:hypothetical protein
MAELFVQVEVSFPDSKLVAQAERQLGLNRDEAMGKLLRLWLAVMRAREGGDLSHRTDSWIEDAVGWRGEPGVFAAFVRDHHTDECGTIRDWQEKYGKLDKQRQQYRDKKREQRRSPAVSSGRSPRPSRGHAEHITHVPETVPTNVPTDVPGAVPQNASNNLSVSQSLSSYQETENSRDAARVSDPLGPMLVEAKLDLSRFGETDRAAIEGALRSSRSPFSRATVIADMLVDHEPDMVGRGFREFMASEQQWSARLFKGFVERAERSAVRDAERKTGRTALKLERRFIDTEAIEREREARETAEGDALLADFERTHEVEYAAFMAEAEATVDRRVPKMMRAAAVRAKLISLVRAWEINGGNNATG